jgi:hypothetical protein
MVTTCCFKESSSFAEFFSLGLVVQDNITEMSIFRQKRRASRKLVQKLLVGLTSNRATCVSVHSQIMQARNPWGKSTFCACMIDDDTSPKSNMRSSAC